MFMVDDKTMENHGNQLYFQKNKLYMITSVCVFPTWLATDVFFFFF
jgi:hypothetical protein